ncbi:Zinc finger protein [Pseudolycoriella hygida]|uniref:Zinc finger protein n=1 Tax=Pseudolycoriella hygida TaxID=35572 RepID=A0A9Q0MT50_9DIPT|nr:Zinc finger protein [Pseudolycoriella hygida]
MTDICRLCASLKILEQLTSITEPNLRIAEKLSRCCSLELSHDELMPQSVCKECVSSLDISWNFAEKACQSQVVLKKAFSTSLFAQDENEVKKSFNGPTKRSEILAPRSVNDLSWRVKSMIISLYTNGSTNDYISQKLNTDLDLVDGWIQMYENERKQPKQRNSVVMNEMPIKMSVALMESENVERETLGESVAPNTIEVAQYKMETDDSCLSRRTSVDGTDTLLHREETDSLCHDQGKEHEIVGLGHDEASDTEELDSNVEEIEIFSTVELHEDDKNEDGSILQSAVEKWKINSWNDYPWKCIDCNSLMVDIHDLRQHHIANHQSTSKYCCVDCAKVFNKYATFLNHVRKHRSHLKFCCDICSTFFWNSKLMQQHRSEHAEKDRSYLCQTCGKGFRCNSTLQVHCRSHLPDEVKNKYNCDICFKKFGTKPNLQAHKRIHSGVRDFTCEHCGKGFVQKGNLENHMLTHIPSKPFSCHCGKTFKTQLRLLKHESVHSNLKPHKCQHCGKEFREKGTLKEHERIHLGLMPFSCDFCEKKFRFKGVLTTHRRQHTGERPYSCIECNHHFTNWPNYNKHMKRRHGINTSVTVRKPQLIPPSGIPPTKLNHVVPTVHNTAYVQQASIPADSRNGHIANNDMMEEDVADANDNGYPPAVQEVNVIVNRTERHGENLLRKSSSNLPASHIAILTQPNRDNINQALTTSSANHLTHQYGFLPNGSAMIGFYSNMQGVDVMQNPHTQ